MHRHLFAVFALIVATMLGVGCDQTRPDERIYHIISEGQAREFLIYKPLPPLVSAASASEPIVLEVEIAALSGLVEGVKILQSPDPGSGNEIAAAVLRWRFRESKGAEAASRLQSRITIYLKEDKRAGQFRPSQPEEVERLWNRKSYEPRT